MQLTRTFGCLVLIGLLAAPPGAAADAGNEPAPPAETTIDDPISVPPIAPPDRQASVALVDELLKSIRTDQLTVDWLANHVTPADLAIVPNSAWFERLRKSWMQSGHVGQALLKSEGIVRVIDGPDYVRVLLAGDPLLSIVLRNHADSSVRISSLDVTSCLLCSESTRWTRDLIQQVRQQGRRSRRLLPGVDIEFKGHLEAKRQLDPDRWPGLFQTKMLTAGWLAAYLSDARVTDSDGNRIFIEYGTGDTDIWPLVYTDGRWKIDMNPLPESSPMHLSSRDMRQLGKKSVAQEQALKHWIPTWRTGPGNLGTWVGSYAVGAIFDPLDATLLLTIYDLDRILAGVIRLDPESHTVLERWPIKPLQPGRPIRVEGWFAQWKTALSPDGHAIAMTSPGRVSILDLATGRQETASHVSDVATLGWSRSLDSGPPALLIARKNGEIRRIHHGVEQRTRIDGTPIAIQFDGDEGRALTEEGGFVAFRFDHREPSVADTTLCCDGLTDGCFGPSGSVTLAACKTPCRSHAAMINNIELVKTEVNGIGSVTHGASWSPDGQYFTTGAVSATHALLLWNATTQTPSSHFGSGQINSVFWSPDSKSLVTTGIQGDVWLWQLEDLLERGLP